ncbi:hypothetical protein LCGC14_0678260 [marine sediment metagenome]|uniref:Uncharacterized protein n=1 Tax=marine sediment metagenome TaxID=412755 RepID=A0A0F9QP15_9ZZZZ
MFHFNLDLTKNKFSWLEKNLKLGFNYFINIILPYFYAKKEVTNSNLTVDDLGKLGYQPFLDALKRTKSNSLKTFISWFKKLSIEKKNSILNSIKDNIEIARRHIQERLKTPTLNSLMQKNIKNQNFNAISKSAMPIEKKIGKKEDYSIHISEELKNLMDEKNLKLRSPPEAYKNQVTLLKFECKKCKNQFQDNIKNIKNRRHPCPICNPTLLVAPPLISLDKDKNIRSFPQMSRLIIAQYIYNSLEQNQKPNVILMALLCNFDAISKEKILSQIPKKEFSQLIKKLDSNKYFAPLQLYFEELIYLVLKLKLKNDSHLPLDNTFLAKHFVKEILKERTISSYNERGLYRIVMELVDFFSEKIPNFKITRKKVENNPQLQIKKDRIRTRLFYYKTQINLLSLFLGGTDKIQCDNFNECSIKFPFLPALDLHHMNEELKTIDPSRLFSSSDYEKSLKILREEGVRPLCSNHHLMLHADIFLEYESFIFSKNIFNLSTKDLANSITSLLEDLPYSLSIKNRQKLLKWIKKRYIIENFYGDVCIGCGKTSIKLLPAFDFHHRTLQEGDKLSWRNLSGWSIPRIEKTIKEQDIVAICSNCHSLIHSEAFIHLADLILGEKKAEQLRNEIDRINKNIDLFIMPNINLRNIFRH